MSLTLRQKCEEVLEHHNLGRFHTQIVDSKSHYRQKVLGIVTECGKIICRIEGITFTRATPPVRETVYAAELLDAFLGTHKKEIDAYVKQFDVVANLPQLPKSPCKNITIENAWGGHSIRYTSEDGIKLYGEFKEDGSIQWNQFDLVIKDHNEGLNIDKLKLPKIKQKDIQAALDWYELFQETQTEKKILETRAEAFARCDI